MDPSAARPSGRNTFAVAAVVRQIARAKEFVATETEMSLGQYWYFERVVADNSNMKDRSNKPFHCSHTEVGRKGFVWRNTLQEHRQIADRKRDRGLNRRSRKIAVAVVAETVGGKRRVGKGRHERRFLGGRLRRFFRENARVRG